FASLTSRPEYALSCVSCSTLVPASSCSTLIVGSSPAGVGWLPAGVRSVVISRPSSHVGDIVGDVVEGRVTVDLVTAGGEHRVLLVRARSRDIGGAHDPDAHALVASGVDVTSVVDGHLVIGGVQRPDVDVVEPALAADEDLVQRPFAAGSARRGGAGVGLGHFAASSAVVVESSPVPLSAGALSAVAWAGAVASAAWFSAKASAASRTHAPSSQARLRWARRCALQGPSPLTTAQNSSQSGVEQS